MAKDDASDAELVRRFQRGESEAYEALVRRFQDRIYRIAAVSLRDTQQTDDAVQEVFLRGLRALRSFRHRSEPFTWLYRTTKNVCREFDRRRPTDPLDEEPADKSAAAEQYVARYQAAERVRQLVLRLPDRQREVVLLRIFEECSVRETARAMGCREGTVKSLLHKATENLRIAWRFDADTR